MPILIDVKPTADPGRLKAQAQELRAIADDLDSGADLYAGATAGMTWRGDAANSFGNALSAYRSRVRAQASQLRTIASAMLKGAADIEQYRASIAKLRSQVGVGHAAATARH